MRSHSPVSGLIAVSILVAAAAAGQSERPPAPEVDSITAADLRADLFFLASDGMQGRLSETPENHLAAEFVASRFARAGPRAARRFVLPATTDSCTAPSAMGTGWRVLGEVTQAVQLGRRLPSAALFALRRARKVLWRSADSVSRRRPSDWNDWDGADLSGRIALILDHEPGEADPDEPLRRRRHLGTLPAVPEGGSGRSAPEQRASSVRAGHVHQHPGRL